MDSSFVAPEKMIAFDLKANILMSVGMAADRSRIQGRRPWSCLRQIMPITNQHRIRVKGKSRFFCAGVANLYHLYVVLTSSQN